MYRKQTTLAHNYFALDLNLVQNKGQILVFY